MGLLRVLIVLTGVFLVALGAGRVWNLKPAHGELDHTRPGQVALLATSTGQPVWVALERGETYRLQQAMTSGDQAVLDEANHRKSAFPVEPRARVRVVRMQTSKREVEILDGPHAGMRGWVEFDLLQPERAPRKSIQPNPRRRY